MSNEIRMPKKTTITPKIAVFGVGGAGCNAVNNLIDAGLEHVEFIACNTDMQSLDACKAQTKIPLAQDEIGGLGAGRDPRVGFNATLKTLPAIMDSIAGIDMVFITAGMGGGTGTGGACIIAKAAKEMGKLCVAVISRPFNFEQRYAANIAQEGIHALSEYVNALIILHNQNLHTVDNGGKTPLTELFKVFDNILCSAISSVQDIISITGNINLDYNDIRSAMNSPGHAAMSIGHADGDDKVDIVVKEVITNRLMDQSVRFDNADGLLISVTGGKGVTLSEFEAVVSGIKQELNISPNAILFTGLNVREDFGDKIRVSLIATGIDIADIDQYTPVGRLVEELKKVEIPAVERKNNSKDLFEEIAYDKPLHPALGESVVSRPVSAGLPETTEEKEESQEPVTLLADDPHPPKEQASTTSTFYDKEMEDIHNNMNSLQEKLTQQAFSSPVAKEEAGESVAVPPAMESEQLEEEAPALQSMPHEEPPASIDEVETVFIPEKPVPLHSDTNISEKVAGTEKRNVISKVFGTFGLTRESGETTTQQVAPRPPYQDIPASLGHKMGSEQQKSSQGDPSMPPLPSFIRQSMEKQKEELAKEESVTTYDNPALSVLKKQAQ